MHYLYTDATVSKEYKSSAIAAVLFSDTIQIAQATAILQAVDDVTIMEAKALHFGLVLAISLNVKDISCFIDSTNLKDKLAKTTGKEDKQLIAKLVLIHKALKNFDKVHINCVEKLLVQEAHDLARGFIQDVYE